MNSPNDPEVPPPEPTLIEGIYHKRISIFDPTPIATAERIAEEATSIVYRARIHSGEHNFSDVPPDPSDGERSQLVAMKSSKTGHGEAGHNECAILMSLRDQGITHAHLARFYAAFHRPSPTDVHILSELGECSLTKLMEDNPQGKSSLSLDDDWLKQQFKGIASALAAVQRSTVTQKILHHDLTPDNILVFKSDDTSEKYRLKIADWGSGSLLPQSHNQNDELHRPPEWFKGATSYPHDIWSLGCVYFRTLVWFQEGFAEHEDFTRDLRHENQREFRKASETGTFFFMVGGGSPTGTWTVSGKMEQCRGDGRCLPWKAFLDMIEKMLEIVADARIGVEDLLSELQALSSGSVCEEVGRGMRDLSVVERNVEL